MFEFDIRQLFPRFILNDRNGYAMAKAIEAGLRYFLDRCQEGISCIQNPDEMPEWRLDEMAGEYNILYDYTADIATKRQWIRDAIQFYSLYGTPEGVIKYLQAAFTSVTLEEWWQYETDPFHFRVTITGEYTARNDEWARKAIAGAKNARSVLDAIIFNAGSSEATLHIGSAAVGVAVDITSRTL